jgi:hypothetical protein
MAFKKKKKFFMFFEELDVLSEGLGDMLWSLKTLHAVLKGNVKHFFC